MKKKLRIPLIAVLAVAALGLTLLLTKPGTDGQNPSAPSLFPRPEGAENRNTADLQEILDGTIISEDGNLVIVYNAHYDVDVYPNTYFGTNWGGVDIGNPLKFIPVYILCRQNTNMGDFSLDIHDTDDERYSTYTYRGTPHNLGPIQGSASSGISFDTNVADESIAVRMTLAGIDWSEALEYYNRMTEADQAYRNSPSTPGNFNARNEARTAYLSYLEHYRQLAAQLETDTPDLHTILLSVNLTSVASGTILREMTLTVGKDTYLLPLGEIRFHDTPPEAESTVQAHDCVYPQIESGIYSWDDGYFTNGFSFRATQAMILDRIEVLDQNGTVVSGAWIRQIDQQTWAPHYSPNEMDSSTAAWAFQTDLFSQIQPTYWTGDTPFYVNAGDLLSLSVEFFSPTLARTAHYQHAMYYALHYTTAQGQGVILLQANLNSQTFYSMELYYAYQEGLDMRPYYTYIEQSGGGLLP